MTYWEKMMALELVAYNGYKDGEFTKADNLLFLLTENLKRKNKDELYTLDIKEYEYPVLLLTNRFLRQTEMNNAEVMEIATKLSMVSANPQRFDLYRTTGLKQLDELLGWFTAAAFGGCFLRMEDTNE